MSHRSIILLILLLAVVWIPSQAQKPLHLASVEVDIWPEYDKPEALVIYRVALPATASLPVDVQFKIPVTAGQPNAVAMRQSDGSLINASYIQRMASGYLELTVTAATPEIQIEYYDPGLIKQGSSRSFDFTWPGNHAVDSLVIQIQQPIGAREMSISPNPGPGKLGQDGMLYYSMEVGALETGQSFTIHLKYQKDTDKLSSSSFQVQPVSPITNQAPGASQLNSALPWLLGALGLLLIVGGGYWYWRSGSQAASSAPRARRRAAPAASLETDGGQVYCHNCGKRALPNDRFCRSCGTELRHS